MKIQQGTRRVTILSYETTSKHIHDLHIHMGSYLTSKRPNLKITRGIHILNGLPELCNQLNKQIKTQVKKRTVRREKLYTFFEATNQDENMQGIHLPLFFYCRSSDSNNKTPEKKCKQNQKTDSFKIYFLMVDYD